MNMKISKFVISNFRKLLKDVTIDITNETLIVGKNNTGKTSVSEVVTKFLNLSKSFKLEDFSSSLITKENIEDIVKVIKNSDESISVEDINELEKKFPKIELDIFIEIADDDNLARIKPLLYEFTNNEILKLSLKFECKNSISFLRDFHAYNQRIKAQEGLDELAFYEFFLRDFNKYYSKNAYISKPENEYQHYVTISEVAKLFNVGLITAQREVDDTSDQNTQNISNSIWGYYQNLKKDSENLNQEDVFKNSIGTIKSNLNTEYNVIFDDLLSIINTNVLDNPNHTIEISSDFSIEEVLKKNSKVKYKIDQFVMPESYNGLGFSNMMFMIIQLITYIHESKKQEKIFNILFLEEPESHLHPQMQSTFLKKIDDLLKDITNSYIILTTHSSYLLQSADLHGVRYFTNLNQGVEVKSLREFFSLPKFSNLDNFLKKYLKINTCDLFFADKAILIEGTVERILINVLIQKFDSEESKHLAKQHITIIEVGGAYAHIFNELLDFLNLKTLIITDIDSVNGTNNKACKCDISNQDSIHDGNERLKTSNAVIKNWKHFEEEKPFIDSIVNKCRNKDYLIEKDSYGIERKMLTFQRPINSENTWGRTFEEQFIIENAKEMDIIKDSALYKAIKKSKISEVIDSETEKVIKENLGGYVFEIVEQIDKTTFALDLLNSDDWSVPSYIKEGLEWLEK